MNVSSRTRYALRILVDLALFAAKRPAQVAQISERQGIPKQFLHQILLGLKSSGMVTSTRGRQGGYMLAMPADRISMAAVVRATHGDLLAPPRDDKEARNRVDAAVGEVWDTIRKGLENNLESMSVQDLCRRTVGRSQWADYSI